MSDSYTRLTDADREQVIDTLGMLARGVSSQAQRRYWFGLMRDQIAARTPEQIEKLERDRGLRAA